MYTPVLINTSVDNVYNGVDKLYTSVDIENNLNNRIMKILFLFVEIYL